MSKNLIGKRIKISYAKHHYFKGTFVIVGVWSAVGYLKLDVTSGDGVVFGVDASKVTYLNNKPVKR